MIEVRPFASLGHADHGWLNARHHFSFAGYHDPARVHWGALRVWNDDEIAAGASALMGQGAEAKPVVLVRGFRGIRHEASTINELLETLVNL